ncbi:MAG: cytochrome c1, partial [Hydrogenophaga sp.]
MKKLISSLALSLAMSGAAWAAGANIPMDAAPQRTNDMSALQNGAKLFVNYCLNCHSASFMRFNRLRDIGLTDKQIAENLAFTTDKIGDTMKVTMNPNDAKAFFGKNPPDLTLVARSRAAIGGHSGPDYLYTFLRS